MNYLLSYFNKVVSLLSVYNLYNLKYVGNKIFITIIHVQNITGYSNTLHKNLSFQISD